MGYYSIGIDFGTQEARAMLVGMDGSCVRSADFSYPHGVMSECLPDGTRLGAGFALQHPQDYIEALDFLMADLFRNDPKLAEQVIGIGIDFTQCTMMPVDEEGIPLCFREELKNEPYAYVKLWKHHGAQQQARRLTETARKRKETFLAYCGGEIYAETMFPKMLETFERAPKVYRRADRFIELADWIPFWLTGSKKRSKSIAGCAALWNPSTGYPSKACLEETAAGFGTAAEKLAGELADVGTPVGYLTQKRAAQYGLPAGIPVAAGLGDCQAAFVGAGLSEEGILLSVMGTSSCDMLVDRRRIGLPGLYGVSADSMIPGMYGYEAGQATMGDLLGWFVNNQVPESYTQKAKEAGMSVFDYLNGLAEAIKPWENGLLALDWWNGNRSVLLDTDLSGMVLGMRMDTRCENIYRALSEALAFGKRRIVEQFETYGIKVKKMYATGGVASKNTFLMQVFSDIMGIPVWISEAENGSCTGSAVYGAVAAGAGAGGYDGLKEAAEAMGGHISRVYMPEERYRQHYDALYKEYKTLYQYFGRENQIMKRLKRQAERGDGD